MTLMWQPGRPTPSHRMRRWLALLLLSLTATAALSAPWPVWAEQQLAGAGSEMTQGSQISGHVVDMQGRAVREAVITLRGPDERPHTAYAGAAGQFSFPAITPGTYQLQASGSQMQSTVTTLTMAASARKDLTLVLTVAKPDTATGAARAPIVPTMEFSDKPNFTIAGVTDWTAAGGHGSDATLRASEDLTRSSVTVVPSGSTAEQHRPSTLPEDRRQEARLRAAVAADPESHTANHQLGAFYLHQGRYGLAAAALKKAASLSTATPEEESELALACRGAGDLPAARQHAARALAASDSAEYERLAAELDEQAGDPYAAVQHFQRAAQLSATEDNIFAWGSELLLHRAVWQAAEVFTNGTTAYPSSARIEAALGASLFAGARYNKAADAFCAASDLEPTNAAIYRQLGQLMLAAPESLSCVPARLQRFLTLQPGDADALYFHAMLQLKAGGSTGDRTDAAGAEILLHKLLQTDPRYVNAYLQLGILAHNRRSYADAVALFTKAIAIDPQQAEAHYRLGVALDRMGRLAEARREFKQHDDLEKAQADVVERQRRQVKQFLVVLTGNPATSKPATGESKNSGTP